MDNNNNNIDNSYDDDLFGMGQQESYIQSQQQENEYVLKIKITNVDRQTLCSLICDESDSTYNIFALRGNLGGNTTGNGIVPKLHGILSLSDSNNNNNNNVPYGSIVCRGLNTASQYDLPLDNNVSLNFCHIDNTRNGSNKCPRS